MRCVAADDGKGTGVDGQSWRCIHPRQSTLALLDKLPQRASDRAYHRICHLRRWDLHYHPQHLALCRRQLPDLFCISGKLSVV